MDTILEFFRTHAGATAGGGGILTLVAVRFLPPLLAAWRERRLDALKERLTEKTEYTTREHELFARLDRKDSVLEKLTGNHIQHLEIQLAQNREFHAVVIKTLEAVTASQNQIVKELSEIRKDSSEASKDMAWLKGNLS
jgi:hypothetical protein